MTRAVISLWVKMWWGALPSDTVTEVGFPAAFPAKQVVTAVSSGYQDALVFDGIAPPATGSAEDPGNPEASAQELQKLNTQIQKLNVSPHVAFLVGTLSLTHFAS